jgi:hypothetical protein
MDKPQGRPLMDGTKKLLNLNREDAKQLFQSLNIREIAKKYDISLSSARRCAYELILKHNIFSEETGITPFIEPMQPFSDDEMDYGHGERLKNQIITKQGLLSFNGNAKILRTPTMLSAVTKQYVTTMLENNQPVKFVNQ